MYEKTQKLILNWNTLETLIQEAVEEKDDDTVVSIYIDHCVKNGRESASCDYVSQVGKSVSYLGVQL
jgi:hypothetical protein